MIKIMVVSRTPWIVSNSFGNTFSNLFSGMEDVEIYNICCQSGASSNDVVKEFAQLSDRSVLKSVFKKNADPCSVQDLNSPTCDGESSKEYIVKIARTTFNYIARDLIWKLGRWKGSKALDDFLKEIQPDLVYLPIYASWYMCDFQNYIANKLDVPVVGHISDDVYGDLRAIRSPLKRFYVRVLRKKLRETISKCAYLEVFAENMQIGYEKLFHKKCYLIGKGVDFSERKFGEKQRREKSKDGSLTLLYTGNLGQGRYKVLCAIARELDAYGEGKATLKVYSATPLDRKMSKAFSKCSSLRFCGQIPYGEVVKQQNKADYLVFVEDFSKGNISAVRMSLSTKIIDYMMAEKPIFAVGPEEIYPIQLLKKNQLAIVSSREEELRENTKSILRGEANESFYIDNSIKYLQEKRDIRTIQKGMLERMRTLINNGKEGC